MRNCWLALLALGFLGPACVSSPAGYDGLKSGLHPQQITHTSGWRIGPNAVSSFDLPDGRVLQYRVSRRDGQSWLKAEYEYELSIEGEPPANRLWCESNHRTKTVQSRFACRIGGAEGPVVFAMAADVPECGFEDWWRAVETNPACFRGRLQTAKEEYVVAFGHLQQTERVVGEVVWTAETSGSAVQALRIGSVPTSFDLYRAPSIEPEHADLLTLHATALNLWGMREVAYIGD